MNLLTKKWFFLFLLLAFLSLGLSAQAVLGLSAGLGYGTVSENFINDGEAAKLVYNAPGLFFDFELDWDQWYLQIGCAVLVSPTSVTLGGRELNLDGYDLNSAVDFTAVGIGYLYPLSSSMELGGSLGLHVSGISLSPSEDDPSLIALEGYYGLVGLSVVPRLRYRINDSVRCTLSIPIGIDFGPMNDEVVDQDGPTGDSNPAIIRPVSLVPEFTGYTLGVYLSIGYFYQLPY